MPYFLDGNNLIGHATGAARPSEEDRAALVAEVCARLRRTRARAVIFFDGPGSQHTTLGDLAIREASGSADEAILRELSRARVPQEITVVTRDRDLARRVRDKGAKSLAPQEFWRQFGARALPPQKDDETGKIDVEEWTRYFDDEANRQ